jgi:hypothetical protein
MGGFLLGAAKFLDILNRGTLLGLSQFSKWGLIKPLAREQPRVFPGGSIGWSCMGHVVFQCDNVLRVLQPPKP